MKILKTKIFAILCFAGFFYGAHAQIKTKTFENGMPKHLIPSESLVTKTMILYRVSPNPSTNLIRIEPQIDNKETTVTEIREIEIIDRSGQIKFKQKLSKGQIQMNLNVSFLPSDIYTLRIFDGEIWYSHKVVVLR